MNRVRVFLAKLRAVVRGRHLDRDCQQQINAHLEEAAEDYMQQGLSPEDARRAALRSFGGVAQTQEVHREIRSFVWLEDAGRDFRYALRSVRRTPGFSAVAILTLALATGAATAIFSVIDATLLRPVPYEKPDEIVVPYVSATYDQRLGPSVTDIEIWRSAPGVFARIGMGRPVGRPVIVDAGVPERLVVGSASEDFLEVFGIVPVLGRDLHLSCSSVTGTGRHVSTPLRMYWAARFSWIANAPQWSAFCP
jgi:hypothetical protein